MTKQEYRKTPEWHEIVVKVMARDNFQCQTCNSGCNLIVHHKTEKDYFKPQLCNLITLCWFCHGRLHNME